MPTIAIVTNHAFATGFIFTLCHNYILMRNNRGFLFMSKLNISLSILAWFTTVFRSKISSPMARRNMLLGSVKLMVEATVERESSSRHMIAG
ncbi:hypothetical protein ACSBR1_008396 [Camellia fascicularis]